MLLIENYLERLEKERVVILGRKETDPMSAIFAFRRAVTVQMSDMSTDWARMVVDEMIKMGSRRQDIDSSLGDPSALVGSKCVACCRRLPSHDEDGF